MSELGGARAHNGSARTGPVPSAGFMPTGSQMRTPRMIMNDRQAREQRRQEEQKRLIDERRQSAERRAAAVSGAAPRISQTSSVYTPEAPPQQPTFESPRSRAVAGAEALGDPTSRASQDYATPRARGPSVSQQNQPRAAPRPAPANTSAHAAPPSQAQPGTAGHERTTSAFPHAFERWETLSSHWEGLTSYWLHKLEQNHEEIRNNVPNAITLNRQITDLSAAGANLFHAVVELQRLRASSERKFQRWFFETRAENERSKENLADLNNKIKLAQTANEEASQQRAEAMIQAENARREMAEIRRELVISKDEARRAWEELGRRNQEALDTAESLKRGLVTVVGGIQVRPHFGAPLTGSASVSRAGTADAGRYYSSASGVAPGGGGGGGGGDDASRILNPGGEPDYYRQDTSPTITDPFMDTEPINLARPYPYGSKQAGLDPATYHAQGSSSMAGPSTATAQGRTSSAQPAASTQASEAQRFYQQQDTTLHPYGPTATTAATSAAGPRPTVRDELRSEGSHLETTSEGDTEYAIDAAGNIRRDAAGRPIAYQRAQRRPHRAESGATDDSEVYDAIAREPEHYRRAGIGASDPDSAGISPLDAPSIPPTSAAAIAAYAPTSAPGEGAARTHEVSPLERQESEHPDYEGTGFSDWEPLQQGSRHRHPTRLSDVLEEEEERSSRRTGE